MTIEDGIGAISNVVAFSLDESRALVLELQTHQIELEMQNEQLRTAQSDLITANNKFSHLYNSSPVGYLTLSKEGIILNANQTFSELVGLDLGSIIGQRFSAFVQEDSADNYYFFLSHIVKTSDTITCDLHLKHHNVEHEKRAATLWVRLNTKVEMDNTGNTLDIYLSLTDITQSKNMYSDLARYATEALESQDRLNNIIKTAVDGIITFNGTGTVDSFNLSAEKMFGYPESEIIGNNVNMLMPEFERSQHDSYLTQYRVTGEKKMIGIEREVWGTRKNGETFPLTLAVSETIWKGEKIYTGRIRDLTEYRYLQKQLQQSQKMEALGTLAGGIAHDFNNILAAILGNIEIAFRYLPVGSLGRKNLDAAHVSGDRAKKLIRQILTFSRMEATSLQPVDLSAVVHDALEMSRSLIPANIEIRENIEAGIIVQADENQMYQILHNLCSNAQQAIGVEGGSIDVVLRKEKRPNKLQVIGETHCIALSVEDSGCGINKQDLVHVFDPFFTTKDVGKGTGLGLAVVDGIVKQHHAHITVDSIKNTGTTFTVFFPLTTAVKVSKTKTKNSDEPSPINCKKTGRILIVDDEESLVTLYDEYLSQEGYIVTVTAEPIKALSMFKKTPNQFDVVITDNNMPNMTGQQLAKEMLTIRPDLPIILSTGFMDTLMEHNIQNLGIRQCLLKPVRLKNLQDAIDTCLD